MARIAASVQARRLLALLHLFKPGTRIPLSVIAERIGATEQDAARDLELLACCGISDEMDDLIPVFVEDGMVEVYNPLPALDRPVRLSALEARALAIALQQAGIEAGDPLLAKLESVSAVGDVSHEELETVLRATAAAEVRDNLMHLSRAIEERQLVAIEYVRGGDETVSERTVEPIELVQERGFWYLEAFCRSAGGLRTFRLDRIRSLSPLPEMFGPRELSPTGAAIVTDGLPLATVRLSPGEEFDARQWPGATLVRQEADGSAVVSVPYAGTGWIARQVAARLGAAEVLDPAEVRDAVARVAGRDM